MRGLFLTPLVVFVLVAGCATKPPPRRQVEQWHAPVAMLEKYADKSGVVTRVAMEAGLKADFDKLDLDHNGCLSPDEVRAENQRRWQLDASTYSPLIDFKQTGCVDFPMYAETARSLFDQLDRKGNGILTPDELHPGGSPTQNNGTDNGEHHHRGGGGGNPGNPSGP